MGEDKSNITKSAIIIGAGLGGLTAGCYAQMNGYNTQIFEMHDKAGGLCTAWERKGYTIDGCVHWLWGSTPSHPYYPTLEELGIIQGKQMIHLDEQMRVEGSDGKVFILYTNADRLEQHMKELAPEDTAIIEEFTGAIRRFANFKLPIDRVLDMYSPLNYLTYIFEIRSYLRSYRKWGKMTMGELAQKFKNPFLREALHQIWEPQMSVLSIINLVLSALHSKSAGYPIGGSMEITRAIETRYLNLGGKISFKKKVDKILVENNRAIGVRLVDGTENKADYVISAADSHATIFEMLEGKYVNNKIRGYYENMPIYAPLIFVGLGVNRSFEDTPKILSGIRLRLEKPLVKDGKEQKFMLVRINNYDPTLAPPGKTSLTILIESAYPYWESLRKDMKQYRKEKERIADEVIATLEKRFPGLTNQVEMRDVATPITYSRYTGNWQGTYQGWLATPKTPLTFLIKKTLPGLDNFYMAGHWTNAGGGLPTAVITGRGAVQLMCKKDKKEFVAVKP